MADEPDQTIQTPVAPATSAPQPVPDEWEPVEDQVPAPPVASQAGGGNEPPAAPPSTPRHYPGAVSLALDLGVSQAEIDESTPQELDRLVRHLTRAAFRAQPQTPPPPRPSSPPPDPEENLWGQDESGNPLSEKDYLPSVAKTIKRAHAQEKELKEIKEVLGRVEQQGRQKQAETEYEQIDRFLDNLGYPQLGKGRLGAGIQLSSPEGARRHAVVSHAAVLAGQGASALQVINYLSQAAEHLLGAKTPPPDPEAEKKAKELEAKKEQWARAGLRKPTHRESPEPNGVPKAAKALAAKMREFGYETSASDNDDDEAGLPEE